jgi:hypothetical protein
MSKYIVHTLVFFIATILTCCKLPPDISVTASASASASANIELTILFKPDTSSVVVPKDADNPQVTLYGTVVNTQTKQPESGVKIRVVGTDTPGGSTVSREDGSWTITLPIVPERNDENLTLFAIEIQKKGAVMAPISEYCKDTVVWELLDIKNSDSYMTAGVFSRSLSWGNLYAKIENHLYITMED